MIAVEGFVPLHHLYDDAYSLAIDQAAEYLHETAQHAGHLFMQRTQDVLQSWLEDFYEQELYLSNGRDVPIRVSKWALKHRFFVDLYYYREPALFAALSAETEGISLKRRFGICDPLPRKWLEAPDHEDDEPCEAEWLEFKNTVIDSVGGTHIPLFVNYLTWAVDFSLFRFVMDDDKPQSEKFDFETLAHAAFLLQFEGFSLCIPEKLFLEGWDTHWKNIAKRKITEHREFLSRIRNIEAEPNGIGRPRKREALADYYRAIFPQGRQGLSWKEVLREIESRYGVSGSIETLKRGLKTQEE